ncbi:transmembrane protein, putative (macronuclear) [Tetrahymena thermophila SB210]|uniref:Transmembrane protein, putative n=1 Tax=Tetrahymena thermophila (strain SB210) TaxID=312017 RepID=Q237J1_TETTS|nr:transmembrane protein, putative [Tetrahymena thermophila SB210]EAR92750.1 transmembrane protein, putative [Tetrahymena thermophila SB210]|eukprot:XP_001012995.1 transmembrane protein, putative [Tetrahymena thermophila SB210]
MNSNYQIFEYTSIKKYCKCGILYFGCKFKSFTTLFFLGIFRLQLLCSIAQTLLLKLFFNSLKSQKSTISEFKRFTLNILGKFQQDIEKKTLQTSKIYKIDIRLNQQQHRLIDTS